MDNCPRVESVSDDMLALSYQERVKALREEANTLYAFCIQKGFSEQELVSCVSRLRGSPKSVTKRAIRDSFSSLIFISILIAMAAIVYAIPSAQNVIAAHYKLATVKFILPYWNFAQLYHQDCLVYNAWLPEPEPVKATKRFCRYCSNIVELNNNTIDRRANVAPGDVLNVYIKNHQPLVVTDATKDWDPSKSLSMDEIGNLFQNNQDFQTFMEDCIYQTNVGFNDTFYEFINAYMDQKLPEKWHANWEICGAKAAKIIRRYYKRPYFLPEMAQAMTSNSIIAAKGNHFDTVFTIIQEELLGRWLTIISGELTVHLIPVEDCQTKFNCTVAKTTLKAGESVFYFPELWQFEYSVTGPDMTIGVMSTLMWDKM